MSKVNRIIDEINSLEGSDFDAVVRFVIDHAGDEDIKREAIIRDIDICPLDHVDDQEEGDIRRLANEIGMFDADSRDIDLLANHIVRGETTEALRLIKELFGGPEPQTVIGCEMARSLS